MATATHKPRPMKQSASGAVHVLEPKPMGFRVFEDNGGSHHWTIVAPDGATLALSEGFPSYADAERAAQRVRSGAGSARFEPENEASPVDLIGRDHDASDDADAERWLDEGGSFSSEAVTRWPTER